MDELSRILVVDDERFHLNVIVDLLGDEYKLLIAKNGARALEIANTQPPPDLILLDVLMPEVNGYEVCRQLKASDKTRSIPVIFLTVKRDVADETLGFSLGAVDYITKPFSPPIVKARVHTHLALNKASRALSSQNEMLEHIVQQRTQQIIATQEERQRLQIRLQQAQKLETIGLLTGGITHDFNNILATILGFADLAMVNLNKNPNEHLSKYLNHILSAGERGKDLVQQLLAFSRGLPMKTQPLNIRDVVNEVLDLLKPILPNSVELSTAVDNYAPEVILNSIQMHQVVMNLLINARDAMHDEGTITIAIGFHENQEQECSACHAPFSGSFVELSIADTGSGIKTELLDKIFEPLFTTKAIGKGTGMGLSVVNDIIHAFNGHILIETDTITGTTFRLFFPPAKIPALQINEISGHQPSFDKLPSTANRILLVHDDLSIALFGKELLELNGYLVTVHTDSAKALDAIITHPNEYDMLIVNQDMPNIKGDALAAALSKQKKSAPIILCDGNSANNPEFAAYTVLTKPVQSEQLIRVVQGLLPIGFAKQINSK